MATILSPVSRPAACAALSASTRSTVVLGPSLDATLAGDHHEEQHEGDDQVDGDPGEDHGEALPGRALAERAGLVGRVDLFHVGHADDAHVAAGGDRLHAVLGLAPGERPEARPEPEEELGDLHARALGRPVVAELVEHHHEDDADDEEQRRAAAGHEDEQRDHRGEEREQDARWPSRLLTSTPASSNGSFTRLPSCGSAQSVDGDRWRARARPGRLPERRRRRERSRCRRRAPRRRSAAMAVQGSGPSRNAATATSLAPLSTAGAPPPARPASNARRRHGKASRSGVSKVSCDTSVQSMAPNASGSRAGAPSARPMGRRMSGIESWAIVAPSTNSTMLCTTDCGCTTTSIWSNGDAEQLVGLDHLEALVHERRRVDRDLGAHVPGGVPERVGHGDRRRAARACSRGTDRRWR